MKTFFVILVIIVLAAIIVVVWLIGKKNEGLAGCLFVLCVPLLIIVPIIFCSIEEKGLYYDYGQTLYTAPLLPVHIPDDGVYLEFRSDSYGAKTYYFKIEEADSIISRKWWQCQVCYHKEEIEPYYELVSKKPKSWAKMILNPNHKRLKPCYFFHVQSHNVCEITSKEYSWDVPY